MLKVKVNNNKEHKIVFDNPTSGTINGNPFALDMVEVKQGSFHIIKDLKSYNVEVVEVDYSQKSFTQYVCCHRSTWKNGRWLNNYVDFPCRHRTRTNSANA